MKNFLKQIFTSESLLVEVWVCVAGAIILAILGIISFREAGVWTLIFLLFGGVFILGAILQSWWIRRK